jgi:RNA-directed DNA polymerase
MAEGGRAGRRTLGRDGGGDAAGAVSSPLLANIYLHYVYDLWVHAWRKRHATGNMIVVRYADDTIVGFQHRADAERFLHDLTERLATFALNLHPEKTRLIEFGRSAASDRIRRGEGKPETFDFLGFTHICGTMRDGRRFQLKRKTKRKRKRATLQRIVDELRRIRHSPIDGQGRWLATVLRGTMPTSRFRPTFRRCARCAITSRCTGS